MNILIYDEKQTLSHLVRSTLRASGHRASISPDPRDAILKLDTGLFDLLVVGPAGARKEVAEFLEEELPHVPILLAGMERSVAALEGIHALPSPLDLGALVSTVRRIETGLDKALSDIAVTVSFGEGPMPCLASRVTRTGMIVEEGNPGYDFHGFFSSSGGRLLTARFDELDVKGQVKYLDRSPAEHVRSVGVTFEQAAEELWDMLCSKLDEKKKKTRRPRIRR